jgi:triphosphoribosyl-dephospho-CoA synthetase
VKFNDPRSEWEKRIERNELTNLGEVREELEKGFDKIAKELRDGFDKLFKVLDITENSLRKFLESQTQIHEEESRKHEMIAVENRLGGSPERSDGGTG